MDYEVDLQTKKKGKELETLWASILQTLAAKFETIPVEQRKTQHDELVDQWGKDIARETGLTFYRNENWLCFCDKELAPS